MHIGRSFNSLYAAWGPHAWARLQFFCFDGDGLQEWVWAQSASSLAASYLAMDRSAYDQGKLL
jgi:hypothetical protein